MSPTSLMLRATVLLSLVAIAGCATNPFALHYRGERLAAVAEARIVTEAPAEGTARELGSSTFLANSDARADEQAVAARQLWEGTPLSALLKRFPAEQRTYLVVAYVLVETGLVAPSSAGAGR